MPYEAEFDEMNDEKFWKKYQSYMKQVEKENKEANKDGRW